MRYLIPAIGLVTLLPLAGCNDNTTPATQSVKTTETRIDTASPPRTTTDTSPSATRPDNTAVNQRDRDAQNMTPGDQSNDPQDLEITRQVRASVVGDSSLSFNAHNIKIITRKGVVTLRGPVKDAAERDNIVAKARAVANVANVDSQLDLQP